MITSPNLSALDFDNNQESDDLSLEIHFGEGNIEFFELVEYDTKRFVLKLKKDYQKLKNIQELWFQDNKQKTDLQYKHWIDSMVHNNYEGFCDTLSEQKMCENERESIFDEFTTIIDNTDFLKSEANQGNIFLNEKVDEKILDQEQINTDAFKKKNKKRRTRKDRRKKEQQSAANSQISQSKEDEKTVAQSLEEREKKFGDEILSKLKYDEMLKKEDKTYAILNCAEGIYLGSINKDSKPDGLGKFCYNDSSEYFGEFDNGNAYFGKLKEPKEGVYYGEFKDGKKDGKGEMLYANGTIYIGDFKDDKRNGQGVYVFVNGHKYVGEFKDNKIYGDGEMIYVKRDNPIKSKSFLFSK